MNDPQQPPSSGQERNEIEFHDGDDGEGLPQLAPPNQASGLSTENRAEPAETSDQPLQPLEIEWFDEEQATRGGKLFAEPAPEPPLQHFEILKDSGPAEPGQESENADSVFVPSPQPTGGYGHTGRSAGRGAPQAPYYVRIVWAFMPLILLIVGYGSVVLTGRGIGYAWDESYYYEPAQNAADWLTDLLRGKPVWDRASIDKYWGGEDNHPEHPSLQKILSGVALRSFPDPRNHLYAMRLPIAILFGLTLTLLYQLGRRMAGPVPGMMTALCYLTMPHIFGFAHLATMETPLIFMTLLVTWCFLRGLDSPIFAVATGVAFGLLLATKINGFFLPVALMLWAQLYARPRYLNNLFAMLTLGPLVFVLAWPWLWHDTPMRILQYLAFHATHQKTSVFFLGYIWGWESPNAPWYYPLTMIAVTTPLFTLLLLAIGLLSVLKRPHRRPLGALFTLVAVVNLAVASAPETPRYDGVRLFLPAYPFLALLAGGGFASIISRMERLLTRRANRDPLQARRFVRGIAIAFALFIVLDGGGFGCVKYYPYLLSYFNPLVGGLAGAERHGFEVTYWGETLTPDVIDEINRLRNDAGGLEVRLKPLALHELNFRHLQRWGYIRPEITIGGEHPFFDYHVLQMRRGFFRRPERALADSGLFPSTTFSKFGVPLIAIYKTGPAFEQYWPTLPRIDASTTPPATR